MTIPALATDMHATRPRRDGLRHVEDENARIPVSYEKLLTHSVKNSVGGAR